MPGVYDFVPQYGESFYKFMLAHLTGGNHITKRLVKIFTRMNILHELKGIVKPYSSPERFTSLGCGNVTTCSLNAGYYDPVNSCYRLMQGLLELFPKVSFEVFYRAM